MDRSGEEEWPILKRLLIAGPDSNGVWIESDFVCVDFIFLIDLIYFYSCSIWSCTEAGKGQDFGGHAVGERQIGWAFTSGRICWWSSVDAICRPCPHGDVRFHPRKSPNFDGRCPSPAQLHGLPTHFGKSADLSSSNFALHCLKVLPL